MVRNGVEFDSSGVQSAEQIAEDHLANGRLPGRLRTVQVDLPVPEFAQNYPDYADKVFREDWRVCTNGRRMRYSWFNCGITIAVGTGYCN